MTKPSYEELADLKRKNELLCLAIEHQRAELLRVRGLLQRMSESSLPDLREWLEAKRATDEYGSVLDYHLDFEVVLQLIQERAGHLQAMLGRAERKMYEMMLERDAALSSRWITVKSQPTEDGKFLVIYKCADETPERAFGYFYKDAGWSRTAVWPDPNAAITHWMPLPTFPQSSSLVPQGAEIRLLRIVAMPVTLLVNMGKGCWFLLCAVADALWVDAFGEQEKP
jgi:hypothetical protein